MIFLRSLVVSQCNLNDKYHACPLILPIQTTRKDGKEMLLFDPSDKWSLLRLLDDDYLESLMTGQNYEVTGKRRV